jgi:hypothetical protein
MLTSAELEQLAEMTTYLETNGTSREVIRILDDYHRRREGVTMPAAQMVKANFAEALVQLKQGQRLVTIQHNLPQDWRDHIPDGWVVSAVADHINTSIGVPGTELVIQAMDEVTETLRKFSTVSARHDIWGGTQGILCGLAYGYPVSDVYGFYRQYLTPRSYPQTPHISYLGPIVECKFTTCKATCDCASHVWRGGHCEVCGSKFETLTTDSEVVAEAIDHALRTIPGEWGERFAELGQHMWIVNPESTAIPTSPAGNYLDDLVLYPIRPSNITAELEEFNSSFAGVVAILRKHYGEDKVSVEWGLVNFTTGQSETNED